MNEYYPDVEKLRDVNTVGIVVPTLGSRPDFLLQSLQAIQASGDTHVCVVCPAQVDLSEYFKSGLIDSRIDDVGVGLAHAINLGLRSLPEAISMVGWIGDDDLLEPGMLKETSELLSTGKVDFIWGQCRYIDAENRELWLNRSGTWAKYLIRFGPNLIPQPGSLFSRKAFNAIGGLSEEFSWAFDQDFFTKLFKEYRSQYIPKVVSSFRWHEGSLSAGARSGSVRESSLIRIRHMPRFLRPLTRLWEPPLQKLIMYAGKRMFKNSG
jgi:hypothetical protein